MTENEEPCELGLKPNFWEVINNRRSHRIFRGESINKITLEMILAKGELAPSSCNRNAVFVLTANASKVGDLLVGGKGWAKNADKILLYFADMSAYKSPNEVMFMPYLDAGVKVMQTSLVCESLGVRNCIVNPNIRAEDKLKFNKLFNQDGYKFCVALVIGL